MLEEIHTESTGCVSAPILTALLNVFLLLQQIPEMIYLEWQKAYLGSVLVVSVYDQSVFWLGNEG
jgi:hypothetical protein